MQANLASHRVFVRVFLLCCSWMYFLMGLSKAINLDYWIILASQIILAGWINSAGCIMSQFILAAFAHYLS